MFFILVKFHNQDIVYFNIVSYIIVSVLSHVVFKSMRNLFHGDYNVLFQICILKRLFFKGMKFYYTKCVMDYDEYSYHVKFVWMDRGVMKYG